MKTYTPAQASEATGISLNYIYTLLRTRKIDGAKREDGRWLVPAKWVQSKQLKEQV